MINIAFCSDCDCMTWEDHLHVHGLLAELGLPAGDSFWLFSPWVDSDFALWRGDMSQKCSGHDRLLEEIRAGRVDVLHGVGSFTPPDEKSPVPYPRREEIRAAMRYLEENGCRIKIWTNHGCQRHHHNMYANAHVGWARGNRPFSSFYVLDIMREHGIEYVWENLQTLPLPYRTLRRDVAPDGSVVKNFRRWAPHWKMCSANLEELISAPTLDRAIQDGDSLILFTHWGMRREGVNSDGPIIPPAGVRALALLAEYQRRGDVRVMRLLDLLHEEEKRTWPEEVSRVGSGTVRAWSGDLPGRDYHANCFAPSFTAAMGSVLERIGHGEESPRRGRLLDAGGGVGGFAILAAERFAEVLCLDSSPEALELGKTISDGLGLRNIRFIPAQLERIPAANGSADVILCRGALYMTEAQLSTREFRRVLAPNGLFVLQFFCDGTYDEELAAHPEKAGYCRMIWNTFHRRAGGDEGLRKLFRHAGEAVDAGDADMLLSRILDSGRVRHADAIRRYRPNLRAGLAQRLLNWARRERGEVVAVDEPTDWRWVCYLPDEIEDLLHEAGFSTVEIRRASEIEPGVADMAGSLPVQFYAFAWS